MKLSETRLDKIFRDYDFESKGFLTTRELKLAFIAVFGYKPSSAEARRLVDAESGLDGVSRDDFVAHCLRRQNKEDASLEVRRVFNALDSRARGFLTAEDIEAACRRVAPGIGADRIKSVIAEVDRSGNGRIALGDFIDCYHMAGDMDAK